MRRKLSTIALTAALAMAGIGFSATSAPAVCMGAGGGTDCPLTPGVPLQAQPHQFNAPGSPEFYTPRTRVRPHVVDRPRHRVDRPRHRVDRPRHRVDRHRVRHPRRIHRGIHRPFITVAPGPGYYYDDDYYDRPRRYQRRTATLSQAHVAWCYDRYRSYRERDNTFQPYEGPRRQCYSPYS